MSYMIEYEGLKFDEFKFRKDLPYIINTLTTPEPHEQDDSEEAWELAEQKHISLVAWKNKYNEELIDKVEESLDNFVNNFCDAFLDE